MFKKFEKIKNISLVFLLAMSALCIANTQTININDPEVNQFISHMVKTYKFDAEALKQLFNKSTYQTTVINTIQKPAEKLPWHRYEKLFLQDNRVTKGVKFWQDHQATLERASKKYGVPEEIIVSLIGVETFYGANKGKFPVLDTLSTLAFYYKPRSEFFTAELEQFLIYTQEEKTDPTTYIGSYAGAMGYPQFMPSSIRKYAVDFSNSGHRDLQNNIDDAIGSVANYLKEFGWLTDKPIVTTAIIDRETFNKHYKDIAPEIDKLTAPTENVNLTIKKLKQYGVTAPIKYKDNLKVNLLSFDTEPPASANANAPADQINQTNQLNLLNKQYKIAFNNFYVITRYNHSQNYALAVYLLSEKLKTEYKKSASTNKT
jgi:membrane-bound lytic murein transglycosylase B